MKNVRFFASLCVMALLVGCSELSEAIEEQIDSEKTADTSVALLGIWDCDFRSVQNGPWYTDSGTWEFYSDGAYQYASAGYVEIEDVPDWGDIDFNYKIASRGTWTLNAVGNIETTHGIHSLQKFEVEYDDQKPYVPIYRPIVEEVLKERTGQRDIFIFNSETNQINPAENGDLNYCEKREL